MLDKITIDDFRPRLGDAFRITADADQAFDARLAEVRELGTGVPGGRRPFALIWRAPLNAFVPQRVFRVEHEQMGVLDIFLVPIGPDGDAMQYEAVFT